MSASICSNCGGTTFEIVESTPRRREISVNVDNSGRPVVVDDSEGYDHFDYELSTFAGYACGNCGAEAKSIEELLVKKGAGR